MSRKKSVVTLADQFASSASNTLIVLALTQVATVETFGQIALYLAVLTFVLALVRGAFGTLLLLSSARSHRSTRLECSMASTASLLCYAPLAAVILVSGASFGRLTVSLSVVAVGLALILQDIQRHAVLARGRADRALLWDGIWALGSGLLLVSTWLDQIFTSPEQLLCGWAMLGIVSYVGLAHWTRGWPQFRLFRLWILRSLSLRVHYGLEASIGAFATAMLFVATSVLISDEATAALRGASTLFGPISVAMSALPLLILPGIGKQNTDLATAWRNVRRPAIMLGVMAAMTVAAVWSIPDRFGELLLGSVWYVTQPIIVLTGIEYTAVVWLSAAFTCWRAARMGLTVLRARLAFSCGTLTAAVVAAVAASNVAAVAGAMALSAVAAAVIAARALSPSRATGIAIRPPRQN